MPLDTGLLDRKIVVQFATESQDPRTHQDILTWGGDETIRAQWLPEGTREFWQARQIHAEISGLYKTHYRDDLVPETARIIGHDSREYDIKGISEIGRREGLLISVVARGESA